MRRYAADDPRRPRFGYGRQGLEAEAGDPNTTEERRREIAILLEDLRVQNEPDLDSTPPEAA